MQEKRHALRFQLLGPVEAWWSRGRLPVGGVKRRTTLAAFLLRPGTVIPLDEIVQAVWGPDALPTLRNAAQAHISRLRRSLPAPSPVAISARSGGYVLDVDPDCIDLYRFRRMVADARTSGRAEQFRQALEVWRGRALADIDSPWLTGLCGGNLEEERLGVVEDWIDAEVREGNYADVLAGLSDLARAHASRERVHELLIIALCQAGRQAEAMLAYERAREWLDRELGVPPGARLQRLARQILGDRAPGTRPALAPAAATAWGRPLAVASVRDAIVPSLTPSSVTSDLCVRG
ncbi:AfsR/SARP family transcriptional regulator [Streptomyces iranensis]|uniref:DNA-binding SARP family transcriptional activator n=1 Tax=Streptomyces iranensis TaxID=576784 RepID=A0A060ZTE1_9ACTN|nr:BTAD domain-containing putative transcriptional regulator [Streptomyces iranensis]MBP2060861.1 DNA-binding SARP family transcriptional activator [Streptomyces iranensis]CDR06322.1 transcriptional regulator, SARP family protein [Streptomyces iranensis]